MLDRHRSHITSTCATALQHLSEIRQLACTGQTPVGGLVSPLPAELRDQLLSALDPLTAAIEGLAAPFASGAEGRRGEAGASAALMWVSILLRTVEDLLEDLSPGRIGRRYGALGSAEAQRLQVQLSRALGSLREAIRSVDKAGLQP